MRLRIVLPPNLANSVQRNAIPVKLELQQSDNKIVTPESVTAEDLGSLDNQGRIAAFSLLQWSGGSLSSFVQLDSKKLSQLVCSLEDQPAFYWANKPQEPISWNGSRLTGVSEHLSEPPESDSDQKASDAPSSDRANHSSDSTRKTETDPLIHYDGSSMIVDGSTHFLAITLPSRNHPFYAEIRERLDAYGFKLEPRNRRWWLRDRHQTLNFLGAYWDDLENRYGATFTDNFISRTQSLKEASVRTEVVEERNAYNLSLSLQAGSVSEQEIRQSLNTGRRYIESGEQIYLVKDSQLQALHTLQKTLSGSPDAPLLHNGRYTVPFSRAPEIEDNLVALNPNFKPPSTWRERSVALKDLSQLANPPLPPNLLEILRPYQKIGIAWLHHLYTHQLGGILADEMGLGKTLQALALLASLQESLRSGHRSKTTLPSPPSLVVCPASLVENWRREAARFCPQLNTFVNHGAQRLTTASDFQAIDLVITSYGTLIRDQEIFSNTEFLCVIGDEAQHIKNRKALNTKAIASIQSSGRFLLTGTPVENSIQDLMSLLDFIMPGSGKGIPQGTRGEDRLWHEQRIKEQAAPYILRRSKTAVAPELPEKIEQVLYIEMTEPQKSVYQQVRRSAEEEIAKLEKSGASEGSIRMKTITQLLRLRQTCCDPRLLNDQLEADASAKLSSFIELVQEAIDGGHRILVFSQFVSILSLLRASLEEQDLPYCYIDGSTRNRMAEVDRFQDSDAIPLFLISLKAGGTGLNLTAADTVIHFDPWWNPAAEAQATDRAHRIGQRNVVTSYKLIISDSVEEKVLQLQNEKRQLLEDIFEASEAANARISLTDLKDLF